MRRATKKSQKAQRRQTIIDAAWELFTENNYDAVSMTAVARRAGVAKGTLYLYFETKETLFLAVLTQHFAAWFDAVDGRLQAIPSPAEIEPVAAAFADTLAVRPALTRLFSLTHLVLEQNTNYEAVKAYKQMLLERVTMTAVHLERLLPFVATGQGGSLLLQMYALLLGTRQMAHIAPTTAQLFADNPDLAVFNVDFEPLFRAAAVSLLHGAAQLEKTA